MKLLFSFIFSFSLLFSSYEEGKEIFENKCTSCHGPHVSIKLLKENFFAKDNKLLNMTIPSVNMLAYAITDSPKKIGDLEDYEMRVWEVGTFLSDYLKNPIELNSVCDPNLLKYYDNKTPISISEEESMFLAEFFLNYKKEYEKLNPSKIILSESDFNDNDLLNIAKNEQKNILVYGFADNCYFCDTMKPVFKDFEVEQLLNENFIFIKVNSEKQKLPFNLNKHYKRITPSFFFVDKNGNYLNSYPGSFKVEDFLRILNENK